MNAARKKLSYDEEIKERSRELIPNLRKWPRWPVLPMKKPGTRDQSSFPDVGFLYADNATDEDGVILYLADIYSFSMMDGEQRKAVKTIEFKTVDELLDAGWIVD